MKDFLKVRTLGPRNLPSFGQNIANPLHPPLNRRPSYVHAPIAIGYKVFPAKRTNKPH